jgi:outer membrane protein TolC
MTRLSLLFVVLLAASPLAAQQARPLSLDDALRTAEENNPSLRGARGDLVSAGARSRQSLGTFLPSLSASLTAGAQNTRTLAGVDPFGRPLPSDSVIETTNSNVSQGLSLSVPIFSPGRLGELRAARADERATRAGVAAEENRVHADVARRYYAAHRAARMIELEERLLAGARERLEATRALMRVAVRSPVDVLGAEVGVSEQERAVEKARGEARRTQLALREAMGVMEEGELALTTAPPAPFDPSAMRVDELVAAALGGHPRVQRSALAADAARRRTSAARWDRLPTLSASAGWNRSGRDKDYGAFPDLFSPPDRGLNFGFSLSLPLFDQFRTSSSIGVARAAEVRAQEDLRASRLSVESEVRSAYIDLGNAYQAVQGTGRTLALARERLDLAQQQYRLGSVTFTDLQDATDSAARAERDDLNARYDFAAAVATLQEKAGPAAPRP